ncbi:protein lifeguard 3-like [Oppia nitens]|uniref:protein lifeguard 3-like n=1 Tax=Oppia nitens TaxID=1686743 RepID=UPI0023DB3FA8|nr:protein lifeguard 3-like [Oppia nitens]
MDAKSNSFRAYVTPDMLWSTHNVRQLNNNNTNETLIIEKPITSVDRSPPVSLSSASLAKTSDQLVMTDNKRDIDIEANYSFVTAPSGVFTDVDVRNGFIRKVYGLLSCIIIATTVCVSLMYIFLKDRINIKHLKDINDNNGLAIVLFFSIMSGLVVCVIQYVFCLSVSARRSVPINYILLIIFTIAMSIVVGIFCCQYIGQSIVTAFILTTVVVLVVTLLATTPWFDITNCGLLLCMLAIIYCIMSIVIFMIVILLEVDYRPWEIVLGVVGSVVFSLFLLYDTQLIIGGKKYEMSPEEYVYAVVCLYVDIIQIFIHILQIIAFITEICFF